MESKAIAKAMYIFVCILIIGTVVGCILRIKPLVAVALFFVVIGEPAQKSIKAKFFGVGEVVSLFGVLLTSGLIATICAICASCLLGKEMVDILYDREGIEEDFQSMLGG